MNNSSDQVLISVIVPVYGVEQYIERCAKSLFEQTMQEGIEFIFVDDCSLDRSIEILEKVLAEYLHRQRQTRILHHKQNRGLPAARQTGIAAAQGEYIAHCDSDDWMDRDACRKIVEKAIAENLDMVIINTHFQLHSGNRVVLFPSELAQRINEDTALSYQMHSAIGDGIVDRIIKKSIYQNTPLLLPATNIGEDLVLTVQLCYYCKKIGCIGQPLNYYYYNSESLINKPTEPVAIKRSGDYKKNIDIVIEFLKQKGLYEKYKYPLSSFKLRCRNLLVPYMNKANYRLWRSTYPELDRWEYFSRLPKKELCQYLLIRSHLYCLYPTFRAIYRRFKYANSNQL